MRLTGLHLLLSYTCNYECEHCFVWGSPQQSGTMTLTQVENILDQGKELGTVEWIYFEGGESFLFYPVLVKGASLAAQMGFKVGIVTNGYWATDLRDAIEWLRPLDGLVADLTVSADIYHASEKMSQAVQTAQAAAEELGMPLGLLSVAQPEATNAATAVGKLPPGESRVMYRGRAAEVLVGRAAKHPWGLYTECPYEDLREPGRVHIDPFGHLHICQGISIGNLFAMPLNEICETYDADAHPMTGPLLRGGPAELARQHGLTSQEEYADACHLCYETRLVLRPQYAEVLTPDQMYGVFEG